MWEWGFVGVLVAVFVGWIAFRIRKYRRLFADEHYLEIAREIAPLKVAALNNAIALGVAEGRSQIAPRAPVTSAGLALSYTVRRSNDRFVHHYSVSAGVASTGRLVGEMFTLFISRLLGVPFEALTLELGRSAVYHAEFDLSAAEQRSFAERAIPKVTTEEIKSFHKEYMEIRKHLRWKRLESGSDLARR